MYTVVHYRTRVCESRTLHLHQDCLGVAKQHYTLHCVIFEGTVQQKIVPG